MDPVQLVSDNWALISLILLVLILWAVIHILFLFIEYAIAKGTFIFLSLRAMDSLKAVRDFLREAELDGVDLGGLGDFLQIYSARLDGEGGFVPMEMSETIRILLEHEEER